VQAVLFRIGDRICAAPAGIVREVLPRLGATRIPGAAAAVEGLVNVRGALLTVVDGHALLGADRRPADEGAIVVVELRGRRIGLGVGEIVDFVSVPDDAITERASLPGVDARVVRAVGLHRGRHFILLDLEALCAPIFGA
jgi:purine-binding chemotaxis protein CheW